MADHSTHISIPTDSDGFISFECSFCGERFKLASGEVQDDDVFVLYCPLCGLNDDPQSFLSRDVLEAARAAAMNLAYDTINDAMKSLERRSKSSSSLHFKAGRPLKNESVPLIMEDESLEIHRFQCCNKRVKVRSIDMQTILKCSYCGMAE